MGDNEWSNRCQSNALPTYNPNGSNAKKEAKKKRDQAQFAPGQHGLANTGQKRLIPKKPTATRCQPSERTQASFASLKGPSESRQSQSQKGPLNIRKVPDDSQQRDAPTAKRQCFDEQVGLGSLAHSHHRYSASHGIAHCAAQSTPTAPATKFSVHDYLPKPCLPADKCAVSAPDARFTTHHPGPRTTHWRATRHAG